MIINKAIHATFPKDNKWSMEFRDSDNHLITLCAIPPTSGNRIDIIQQTDSITSDGFCYQTKYLYNYKGKIRKLKGKLIIIEIKDGKPEIR